MDVVGASRLDDSFSEAMRVHVVCMRPNADRVLPRHARYLLEYNGWTVSEDIDPGVDVQYLVNYIDGRRKIASWEGKVAALFTHWIEEKSDLWTGMAERADVRLVQAKVYGEKLKEFGPTAVIGTPIERERFIIAPFPSVDVVGTGGFCRGKRKGAHLLKQLAKHEIAGHVHLVASGEGWPVPTRGYPWAEMPVFYQSLRVYLCTSLVEGGPQGPYEALSCGVPVVVPSGVGSMDELPEMVGVRHYERGDFDSMVAALEKTLSEVPDRKALRALTEECAVEKWCQRTAEAIECIA